MKKALELVFRGHREAAAFACPYCGKLFPLSARELESFDARKLRKCAAESCCSRVCARCSVPTKGENFCPLCTAENIQAAALSRREEAYRTAQALSIDLYDGPLYWAEKERYFRSLDDLLDACEEENLEVPPRVFACVIQTLALDAADILEQAVDDGELFEDAREQVPQEEEKELQSLLDAWCAKQRLESWVSDYSRVILIDQEAKP